jgi:hypothetical protein
MGKGMKRKKLRRGEKISNDSRDRKVKVGGSGGKWREVEGREGDENVRSLRRKRLSNQNNKTHL